MEKESKVVEQLETNSKHDNESFEQLSLELISTNSIYSKMDLQFKQLFIDPAILK